MLTGVVGHHQFTIPTGKQKKGNSRSRCESPTDGAAKGDHEDSDPTNSADQAHETRHKSTPYRSISTSPWSMRPFWVLRFVTGCLSPVESVDSVPFNRKLTHHPNINQNLSTINSSIQQPKQKSHTMSRLPFLPGYTFADPAKRTFRKSHLIDRSGGVTVVSDGAGTWNEKKKSLRQPNGVISVCHPPARQGVGLATRDSQRHWNVCDYCGF